jgi:O-antigen ligase
VKRAIYIIAAALLLGVLFAQAMTSIPRLSITFDEDLHISTGYSILRTGDTRLVEDHPPLIGLWMSWPLLLSPDVPDPEDVPSWPQGDRRLFVRNELWWNLPIDQWVVPPRIPIAWLALLLGAFLFRWASEWFGPTAGLLALALLAFDPNILAYGTLATLDLGAAVLIFVAVYSVYRYLRRPSRTKLVLAGIMLGLALSAKISGAIVLPVCVGLVILWGLKYWRNRLIIRLITFLGVAFLTLWAVHLFGFGPPEGLSFSLPAPTFWRSFLRVGRHAATGNRAYLLGETYQGGRWYYFPVAFLLKTPLPALVLLGLALLVALRSRRRWWRELVLISLPLAYFIISMVNQINIGYRHLLPILPFVYLFIARLAGPDVRFGRSKRSKAINVGAIIVVVLLVWQVVGTLRVWPFHITFFNEVAGGPRNGYRTLADSNVDWGQGLKALRTYLEDQSWPDIQLSSYVFFIRPELYGVQATPLPPLAGVSPVFPRRFNPAPGTYVISASTLRGLKLVEAEMYDWFAQREPDDVVANSMLVYRVSEPAPQPNWLAQCSVPVTPLSREAVVDGFGLDDLRLLAFDCTQSWVNPQAGQSAGWYVVHQDIVSKEDDFIEQQLAPARLSFEQKTPHEVPALTILEWNPLPEIPAPGSGPVWAAPVDWSPAQATSNGTSVSPPVSLDGPLTFAGHEIHQDGRTITLITYWLVEARPGRPFSLMAHLIDAEGRPVVVGDGLGVPVEQLEPGDLLVQRHDLSVPGEVPAGTYWLQTGVYWLDTVVRFSVLEGGQPVGDRLLLSPVELE